MLQVNNIDRFKVRFAVFESNREVVQCFRCQRVGHTAPNCKITRRCVKCSLTHKRGEWLADREPGRKHIKCALCGLGHTANAPICHIRRLEMEKNKRSQKSAVISKPNDSPSDDNLSLPPAMHPTRGTRRDSFAISSRVVVPRVAGHDDRRPLWKNLASEM